MHNFIIKLYNILAANWLLQTMEKNTQGHCMRYSIDVISAVCACALITISYDPICNRSPILKPLNHFETARPDSKLQCITGPF